MSRTGRLRGFTLIELVIVMAIMALLVSVLLPALKSVRHQARNIVCMSNLKSIAFNFNLSVNNPGSVRYDAKTTSDIENGFWLTSFVDKIYSAGVYYESSEPLTPYVRGSEVFFCPSSAPQLSVKGDRDHVLDHPNSAVSPIENVSYAFNARLRRVMRPVMHGGHDQLHVMLGPNLTNWRRGPRMPLLMDVDAAKAVQANEIAPAIENMGVYSAHPIYPLGKYWRPKPVHGGKSNIARLDGSVHHTDNLLDNPELEWRDADWQDINGDGKLSDLEDMGETFIPDSALTSEQDHH